MAKISIVIPVYNSEKYIEDTLKSVINQSFKDIEIICVDDGSSDNSLSILELYRNKDSRIRIISQENKGVVTARNNGIKEATSEYIYTLDSDDLIDKTLLEKSYNAINSGKGDVITCRVQLFGEASGEVMFSEPNKINMACHNCLVNAALFKKDLFEKSGGFDHLFDQGIEDYDFWLNLIYRYNARFYRIDEVLFFYRIKNSKESRNAQQKEFFQKQLENNLLLKYPEIKKYKFIYNLKRFIFRKKKRGNNFIFKLFGISFFRISCSYNKKIYFLFNFIPIFCKKK